MAEEITQLLVRWGNGDEAALAQLMPLVYQELRRLAQSFLRKQVGYQTLQPTALVNEAYLRLVRQKQVNLQTRAQFFGLAATVMRSLLIDHLRERRAEKRGGGVQYLSLSEAQPLVSRNEVDLLALDEALHKLAAIKPRHSRVVELRYFGGLSIEETASFLGISHATVEREWSFARTWLRRELS